MSLKNNWNELCRKALAQGRYWELTSTNMQMYSIMKTLTASLRGGERVLDIGAGGLAFKEFFPGCAYTAFDKTQTSEALDFVADASRIPIADGSVDIALCSAVLEHTKEPLSILREMKRVVSPGGTAIVTVPHLHYIHGEPEDYYRFTRFGIEHLLQEAGFEVSAIIPVGGLISFLSTLASTFFLSL